METSPVAADSVEQPESLSTGAVHGKTSVERWRQTATRMGAVVWLLGAGATEPALGMNTPTARVLFIVGALLTILATAGRSWCLIAIAGNKTRTLITDGPYSLCRNPLYVFSLLGSIGVGLATRTVSVPFVAVAAFAVYYFGVVRSEESRLSEIHGDTFADYRAKVSAWLPHFGNYKPLVGVREVNARSLTRGMADSGWFFLAFVGLDFLAELRQTHEFFFWWTLP